MSKYPYSDYGQRIRMDDRPTDCWVSLLPCWLGSARDKWDDFGENCVRTQLPEQERMGELIDQEPMLFRIWCDPEAPEEPVIFDSELGFGAKEAWVRFDEKNLLQRIVVSNNGLTFPPTQPGTFARGFAADFLHESARRDGFFRFVAMDLKKEFRGQGGLSKKFTLTVLEEVYREREFEEFEDLNLRHWPVNFALIDDYLLEPDSDHPFDDDSVSQRIPDEWFQFLCPLGIDMDTLSSLWSAYDESIGSDGGGGFEFIQEYCHPAMENIEARERSSLIVHELPLAANNGDKYCMEFEDECYFSNSEDLFVFRLEEQLTSSKMITSSVCFGSFAMLTNDLLWLYFNAEKRRLRLCELCGAKLLSGHAKQRVCAKKDNPDCYRSFERKRKNIYRKRTRFELKNRRTAEVLPHTTS